jgi:hypothetical protein
MIVWDLLTWLAIAVLGPGTLIIFVLFLRDLRGLLRGADRREGHPATPAPDEAEH